MHETDGFDEAHENHGGHAITPNIDRLAREGMRFTDAHAPGPPAIAGQLERDGYDFATRTLEVSLKPDSGLGSTEIFVPADRFYPDGLRVEVDSGLTLALPPGEAQLCMVKFAGETSREQARLVHQKKAKP